ncbi:MAG: 30S ribosomal protein S6 [Desulfonatronovibrionaceae bacterium]
MKKYETLLLLDPELGSEGRQTLLDKLSGIVERDGGQIVEVDDWGQKELAYPVRKVTRGRYVRLEYGLPELKVTELERNIRISEGVFKFLTVKLDDEFVQEAS